MLSQQEMSDRLEIQDLLAVYCEAIDGRDWDALDDIFTADATIDYTEAGGAKGNLTDTKAYLAKALKPFAGMQHMLGLPVIKIEGDKAKARTTTFNPMVIEQDGKPHIFFVGLWYCDELIRTEQGWRIQSRREEVSYFHNLPENFAPVDP
ncbi:nuclear transport factor 2 family protein [Hellea sp.]|nr:nuclear transport factor 2 family protein [Hellea sp.]